MKSRAVLLVQAGLLLATALSLSAAPPASNAPKLLRLPPKARAVVREQVGDSKIDRISRSNEDGKIIFDVEITRAGKARSFSVSRDGEMIEFQVFPEELPAAVQDTIRRVSTGWALGEIDRTTEEGKQEYDAEMTRNGITRSFSIAANGALLSMEIPLGEAPAAVQKTIQSELKGTTLDGLELNQENGETTYEAEYTLSGKTRGLSVATNGDLLSEELALADLPTAVQTALQKFSQDTKHLTFSKSTEDGEIYFDITLADDSASWSFDSDGNVAVIEKRIALSEAPAPVQTAIKSHSGGENISSLRKSTQDDETTYEVEFGTGTGTFNADGTVAEN